MSCCCNDENEKVVLKFWKEREDAQIPEIAYENSSGAFDIRSCEEVVIPAHSRKTVPNGLRIMIPRGYYAVFHEKSGLYFKKNLKVFNGLIDFGYTGELSVMVENHSNEDITIEKGQKYVQVQFFKIPEFQIEEATLEEFETYKNDENNLRKDGGFGSSGK